MASIFISYRREDSGGHAGRLCDRLTARFGGDRVFMDIQDIHPGQNFARSIDETVATCDCVLAVIGPRWVEMLRERMAEESDFVRHEIAAALARSITVVPVLVGGARMPEPADLPRDLAELGRRQAVTIRDDRFDSDVAVLEQAIASQIGPRASSPTATSARPQLPMMIAAALTLVVLAAGGYVALRAPTQEGTTAAGAAIDSARPAAAPNIAGEWVAQLEKRGQQPFRIRLTFQQLGTQIAGVVRYPTGDAPIHDATFDGRALSFATTHVPQFASEPATIRFQAEVGTDEIRLMTTDDNGVAMGVARRAAPADAAP